MSNISYRGKEYNAALLVAIAGQGVAIEIDAGQIAFVDSYALLDANKAKPVLVVAKNGNAYDLLAATYDKLVSPDGLRIQGKVKVILMSKHVLAKAEVSAVQERLRSAADEDRVHQHQTAARHAKRFLSERTFDGYPKTAADQSRRY